MKVTALFKIHRQQRTLFAGVLVLLLGSEALSGQKCEPARAENDPISEFVDQAEGTITHRVTGLMWKRCAEGQTWTGKTCNGLASGFDWAKALVHVRDVNRAAGYAGFTDWRLPNIKELRSIVDERCVEPAINSSAFPASPGHLVWSASNNPTGNLWAWAVDFSDGGSMISYTREGFRVRLVRDAATMPEN